MIIVDSHHQVLSFWTEFRRGLPKAPRLITLDHHTDTSPPFRHFLRHEHPDLSPEQTGALRAQMLKRIDYRDPVSVVAAIEHLSHDEHIQTAIACDIIHSAYVIAHNAIDTDLDTFARHRIMCRAVEPDTRLRKVAREICDRVIESEFLAPRISSFDHDLSKLGFSGLMSEPYILDIDLDYFNTLDSVRPADSVYLQELALNAGLITVALERGHVRHCALDPELTSEYLLAELKKILQKQ